jgi:hypothetical protein
MPSPVTLHYTEPLVRRAVRAFWWRVVGWKFIAALLLLFIALAIGLAHGDRSWWIGALGTVLAFGLLFAATIYITHHRSSLTRFRRLQKPESTLELGETHLRMESDSGSAEISWSTTTALWRFPDFWLLFLSPAQFITLPTADLDECTRDFILAKLKTTGAKVS